MKPEFIFLVLSFLLSVLACTVKSQPGEPGDGTYKNKKNKSLLELRHHTKRVLKTQADVDRFLMSRERKIVDLIGETKSPHPHHLLGKQTNTIFPGLKLQEFRKTFNDPKNPYTTMDGKKDSFRDPMSYTKNKLPAIQVLGQTLTQQPGSYNVGRVHARFAYGDGWVPKHVDGIFKDPKSESSKVKTAGLTPLPNTIPASSNNSPKSSYDSDSKIAGTSKTRTGKIDFQNTLLNPSKKPKLKPTSKTFKTSGSNRNSPYPSRSGSISGSNNSPSSPRSLNSRRNSYSSSSGSNNSPSSASGYHKRMNPPSSSSGSQAGLNKRRRY
ncbi:unnamed protein product [Allacma fusca]|uniref:Uncharacterized protein n=1 Tax=Allacma fusca TaxID=39272 RepID=A0A8J2L070_9HEXA|nr:unnamed protein product [Allacma fusca]